MKSFNPILIFICLLLAGALFFPACIDEDFDQPPTEGVDPGLTVTTTIAELKALHKKGQFETIQEALVVKGVIVADDATGNWYRTFVLQDETGGIEVLVDLTDSYVLYPRGREVYIKCKGLVLGDYNDLVQLGGYVTRDQELGPVLSVGGNLVRSVKKDVPEPKLKVFNQLTPADVSTLVRFENVQFISGDTSTTFADPLTKDAYNLTIENCAFQPLILRTSGFATFAGAPIPNGSGTIIGILGVYRGDYQLLVRDLKDVFLDGTRCIFDPCAGTVVTEVASVDEPFSTGADNQDVKITGWSNVATKGSRLWRWRVFDGNFYAQATAFGDNSNQQMETWLITPAIKLDVPKVLSFESAKAFWVHDGLSVWVSKDFVCDPKQATWQPLNATIAKQSDTDHVFIGSGTIDLSGLTGKVFIGFKYTGSGPGGQTTTYRVDNVVVKNK